MKQKNIKSILSNYRILVFLFMMIAIGASIQSLTLEKKSSVEGGLEYNRYNNYTIFKASFSHLKEGKSLYVLYPEEHWDLYKYTPSFAVFFGLFAIFPDWLGLPLWNLFSVLIFLIAVYYLPKVNIYQKGLILLFCTIELITSIQNAQSNVLIVGLILLAFALLERNKYLIAVFCVIFSVFIKLFGIVGLALFLFYPKKWKLALYSALCLSLLLALPLLFIGFNQYEMLLSGYWNMLMNDYSISYGYSLIGWLNIWFGLESNKLIIVAVGVLIFLIPLFRYKEYKTYTFRILTLCSILIWVILFNHKAESPTMIIAMSGVSIWFVISGKSNLNMILFLAALLLVSLSATDLFPHYIREAIIEPYAIKVIPLILIWLKIIYDMTVLNKKKLDIE